LLSDPYNSGGQEKGSGEGEISGYQREVLLFAVAGLVPDRAGNLALFSRGRQSIDRNRLVFFGRAATVGRRRPVRHLPAGVRGQVLVDGKTGGSNIRQ